MSTFLPEDYEQLRTIVLEGSGIVLEADKQYLAETRLEPLLSRLGIPTLTKLLHRLEDPTQPPDLRRQVIEAMVNGETLFFRDAPMFDMLRHHLLPRLLAARAHERRLVIWSAASSTGQEPYSIAMLLEESFPELRGWDVEIRGTDLSSAHLLRARSGLYSQYEINRGLPASSLVRWFSQVGSEWLIHREVRERVKFSQLNLVTDWPPAASIDLVLLRNVMIYWDDDTKRTVLGKIRHVLASDGALVLGSSESLLHFEDEFENVPVGRASHFRKANRSPTALSCRP